MLFYLFNYLVELDIPGAGLFQYISFRSAMALLTSLLFSLFIGKRMIEFLQKQQIGEIVRDLGLEGQVKKTGTPTMGGVIILSSLLLSTLLFTELGNIYIILMIVTTIWLGSVGFADDYIKVFKKNKEGLAGKMKILGQVSLGLVIGITLYVSDTAVVRELVYTGESQSVVSNDQGIDKVVMRKHYVTSDTKSTTTTIPFFKDNEFDYSKILWFLGNEESKKWAWIVFVVVVVFIVTAVSNGSNMTDGLDGLATGTSAIIVTTLGIFAYVSGNIIYASYLNIMYIPYTGELVVFSSAFLGALIGFLWYNSYPAQVFMGDTGSLAIGGIIGVMAIIVRKELLLPLLCGIFFIESLSVMMQVSYFKYTKKKYGEGRRIFLMSPLHHHFQKKGYHEAKIVNRFLIVGILLAVISVITLKLR